MKIFTNETEAYTTILEDILKNGKREGRYKELLNLFVSIENSNKGLKNFLQIQKILKNELGLHWIKGKRKGVKTYTNPNNRIQKPSYIGRLVRYEHANLYINQIKNLSMRLAEKPGYNCISFSILHPTDLINMIRPGYVPCIISGDIKFRHNKLNMNVFFRTCDALSVLDTDIFFLRTIQRDILNKSKLITSNEKLLNANIGTLNLFFSRVFYHKSIKICPTNTIEGDKAVQNIIQKVNDL